ncbi:ATP synthase F1 subunit epsilon [Buchnera aphidicola (Kurisakia onigurumii)]|uniref:ATP synthase F1 subunit epsilon n=1 Tax=Buchnera aphidicola TaxID=9 RepID=UPI0031B70763
MKKKIKNIKLNVVSPESTFFSQYVKKIIVSGIEGNLGIYPGHRQLLTFVKPGILYIFMLEKKIEYIYIYSGILEVQPSFINILADNAIISNKINLNTTLKKKYRLENELKKNIISMEEKLKIKKSLSRQLCKIKILEMLKSKIYTKKNF